MCSLLSGNPTIKKIPHDIKSMGPAERRQLLDSHINDFLHEYVFDADTSQHLNLISDEITKLRQLDDHGYPCRSPGCPRKFKYHSGRVK